MAMFGEFMVLTGLPGKPNSPLGPCGPIGPCWEQNSFLNMHLQHSSLNRKKFKLTVLKKIENLNFVVFVFVACCQYLLEFQGLQLYRYLPENKIHLH